MTGSLGDDKTHFKTDLNMQLAPVADPKMLSFDLTGTVLEIDPRIMADVFDRLGIRSAPFGIDPLLHCRDGRFENSRIALNLRGMGNIVVLLLEIHYASPLHPSLLLAPFPLQAACGGLPPLFQKSGNIEKAYMSFL